MSAAHATQASGGDEQVHLGTLAPKMARLGLILAVVGYAVGGGLWASQTVDAKAFWHAYSLAATYFIAISAAALCFVQIQHLTRAGWSTSLRRLAEIIAAGLPVMTLLLLPAVVWTCIGHGDLLVWADPAMVLHEPLLAKKAAFLNLPFFAVRYAIYLVVWSFFTSFFLRRSIAQDGSGDLRESYTMQWVAAPATAFFALSFTFFTFDFIMALEPTFFSTVFGIYVFAGGTMAFYASMVLLSRFLQSHGILATSFHQEHYHDLGKFMFGFMFFWGYLGFSQYMLIWYGNIPEETQWFLRRQEGQWAWVSLALLVGHLLLPFPGLLSRHVKRHKWALMFWAVWLLAMEYLDLFWLVMPSQAIVHGEEPGMLAPHFGLLEISMWLGAAGVFLLNFALRGRHVALRPLKDPRLEEAFVFENA